MRHNTKSRTGLAWLAGGVLALTAMTGAPPAAAEEGTVNFAFQAWPGVTVKTEVATQLLETMGYDTESTDLSSTFIYQGFRSGDVDVSFGAWMPAHKPMVQPVLEDGSAMKLAVNMKGAIQGLAVPTYVWESGVHSVSDLAEHGGIFNRKIYGIEPGAGMSRKFRHAIETDHQGLGDWELMTSSTAGMLAQVGRATSREEAIVFHGWKPHWMAIKYDMRFLEGEPDSEIAGIESTVLTIVASDFPEKYPEVTQFLRRYKVSPETQSRWIYEYSYEERSVEEVAQEWISQNMDAVAGWLEGVQTTEGEPAIEAVKAEFGGS